MNNLATHRLTLLLRLSICLLVFACFTSVAKAQRGSAVALVPQRAVAIARLNWKLVRSDAQFRSMLNANQLDRALSDLNINGSQISEIVIFSGINTSPNGLVGGIFEGSYDVGQVQSGAVAQSRDVCESNVRRRQRQIEERLCRAARNGIASEHAIAT